MRRSLTVLMMAVLLVLAILFSACEDASGVSVGSGASMPEAVSVPEEGVPGGEPESTAPDSSIPVASMVPEDEGPEEILPQTEFGTVDELRQVGEELQAGDVVTTLGYYQVGDGGEGSYELVPADGQEDNGGTLFLMQNGLAARLIMEDGAVSVMQFGAVADGVTDDYPALMAAFTSGASVVRFPESRNFMVKSRVLLPGDLTLEGNGSTLLTGNEYVGGSEFFMDIRNVNNVTIDRLNFTATQIGQVDYWTQIGVRNATNINITNCILTGPQPDYSGAASTIGNFNNIDLYTGWHDVTITGCTLTLSHDGEAGLCLLARDLLGNPSSGLVFSNNTLSKVSHDEIIVVGGENATIDNCYFGNNTMYMRSNSSSNSNVCISLSTWRTVKSTNIVFENNTLDAVGAFTCIMSSGPTENVRVSGNTIRFSRGPGRGSEGGSSYLFSQGAMGLVKNYEISNNHIIVDNTGNYLLNNMFSVEADITGNTVELQGSLPGLFFGEQTNSATGNTISVTGDMGSLCYNVEKLTNNTVNVGGGVSSLFRYYNMALAEPLVIEGNTITQGDAQATRYILSATQLLMNGQTIKLANNEFQASGAKNTDYLYAVQMADSVEQEMVIERDNRISENFSRTYSAPRELLTVNNRLGEEPEVSEPISEPEVSEPISEPDASEPDSSLPVSEDLSQPDSAPEDTSDSISVPEPASLVADESVVAEDISDDVTPAGALGGGSGWTWVLLVLMIAVVLVVVLLFVKKRQSEASGKDDAEDKK